MAKGINYAKLYTLRKDGRYQGKYTDSNGKRHTVCDRDPEVLYYKLLEKQKPQPFTFKEIAEAWQDKHWERIREGTRICYAPALKRAIDRFGNEEAAKIGANDIYNHLVSLNDQGFSASTIKTQRIVYSLIYQNAVIDDAFGREIKQSPANNIPMPKRLMKPAAREAPEDEIVAKIIANAETAYFGIYALFLICTGFRRGEALGVQWRDIDFVNKTIACNKTLSYEGLDVGIREPKSESGYRQVVLIPVLEKALKKHKPKDAKLTDFVFFGSDPSTYMPFSTFRRRWNHYCKDMGFVEETVEQRTSVDGRRYSVTLYDNTITPHVLRHGYATMLFDSGTDEQTAKMLMGHSSVDITRRVYEHLRQKRKTESLEKFASYMENLSSPATNGE